MLDAALDGNAIPTSVVENLIAAGARRRRAAAPLRAAAQARARPRELPPLRRHHPARRVRPALSVSRRHRLDRRVDRRCSAPTTRRACRRAFAERWIDVYENPGKHSGAYSASVYGVHPYMLLNWNDTLDSVFTLAHEMGHSMHTMLAHETQPFVYSSYTIFVAEVPSTLSEALLLDYMLARATDPRERIVLLQHAIDEVTSTFYRQVLFANYELEAHRLVERGEPITAESLSALYRGLLTRLLRRHADRRPAAARDVGPHPALLRLAVLRLSVRHLLRLERPAAAGRARATIRRSARTASRRFLDLLRAGSKRPPDGAAASGRRRPRAAGDGRRHRQPPRHLVEPARDRAGRPRASADAPMTAQACRPHHRRQRRDRPRPDHRASPPTAASRSSRST